VKSNFSKWTNHLQSKFTIICQKNYKKSLLCGLISQTSAEKPPKNGGVRKANWTSLSSRMQLASGHFITAPSLYGTNFQRTLNLVPPLTFKYKLHKYLLEKHFTIWLFCWAIIFLTIIRFPPGVSIADTLYILYIVLMSMLYFTILL
jgi:hypothetical protein